MEINFKILDVLIKDNVAFAIYRLPASDEIHLIVEQDNQPFTTNDLSNLAGGSGFVMSPFVVSPQQPVVLIRPDLHLTGTDSIQHYLHAYKPQSTAACLAPDSVDRSTTKEEYTNMFRCFRQALAAGEFDKLVLSRQKNIPLPDRFSPGITFQKALSTYPNAFVYLANTSYTGTWLGSAPELFLSGEDQTYHTVALAGTQAVAETCDIATLRWNEKNRREQKIVSDYFCQLFDQNKLQYAHSPTYTFRVGNLAHLKTDFHFQEREDVSLAHILELIHPTPAVCGFPKQEAFQFINIHELHSRRYYSGFIGNLSMNNRTDLYVNLRCMQIFRKFLTLYAGGGILISSDVEEEWIETEDKMQAMLNILH